MKDDGRKTRDKMRYLIFGVVCFVVFCGVLVFESGLFDASHTVGRSCILLQQTTADENQVISDAPASGEEHLEAADIGGFRADNAVARSLTLGSVDPESGFRFQLELSSQGAAIRKATFSEFDDRDYKDPQPLMLLSPVQTLNGDEVLSMANTNFLFVDDGLQLPLDRLQWESFEVEKDSDGSQTVRFEAIIKTSSGEPAIKLTKTYKVSVGGYHLDCSVTIENLSTSEQNVRFNLTGPVGIGREDSRSDERKIVGGFRDSKGQIVGVRLGASSFDLRQTFAEEVLGGEYQKNQEFLWSAVVNKYFAAILVPLPESGKRFCDWISGKRNQVGDRDVMLRERRGLSYSIRRFLTGKSYGEQVERTGRFGRFYNFDGQKASGDENIGVGLEIDFAILGPAGQANASRTYSFQLYLGPKDKSLFDKNERYKTLGFVQTIDFLACCCPASVIQPLAFGILAIMKWMYGFIRNYGVVIIILVFVLRIAIHPLTKKSQVSMSKMSKLAPKAEEIKKKYANNKTEMNKQLMALYKEQGASPFIGMLPMVVQMPIWIALYSAIYASIDLRGAAFLPVWITDLSVPDALFRFSAVNLPFFGKLDSFNLLPILMGVAFYFQQKLMPSQPSASTNPQVAQQQKMMMVMMPILFPLMLYKAPSGLNLYIMASTFAGVIEQHVIRKHIRGKEEAESKGLVSATSKTGGKVKKKKPKPFFKQY
jgi:YidC/Oxa1 family membrane protein insertase